MNFAIAEVAGFDDFDDNPEFNPGWWVDRLSQRGSSVLLTVQHDGDEVARVELLEEANISSYTPDLEDVGLDINFFEVAASRRRERIGTQLVSVLAERSPRTSPVRPERGR